MAVADPRAMVQRRRAADGGGPRGIGGRGVRGVHVQLGSRRAARVRVHAQLPAPVATSLRVGVVALVPARVPRPGADAEVHRSPAHPLALRSRSSGFGPCGRSVDVAARWPSAAYVGLPVGIGELSCRSRTGCSRRTEARGGWSRRAEWCRSGRLRRWGGSSRSRSGRCRRCTPDPVGLGCGGVRVGGRGRGAGAGSPVRRAGAVDVRLLLRRQAKLDTVSALD